jgi:putative Ca2+/H+ antiporter (TMEM165/GDT1 family)
VFLGVAAAFALHVTLAVAAGSALSHLPERPVALATALAFGAGAAVMWRSAGGQDADADQVFDPERPTTGSPGRAGTGVTAGSWAAVLSSFAVVAVAEFGDLTQLATAGLAVHTGAPVEVAIGSFAALCAVAGLAVIVGQRLLRRLRIETLQKVAAAVFAFLALAALVKVV